MRRVLHDKQRSVCTLLFFIFSFSIYSQGCGALMEPISIQERVDNATKVIEGEIISSKSYWDTQRHDIYTVHEVKVYKKIKGDPSKVTRIVTTGGQVDNEIEISSSAAKLSVGTVGVFFLKHFDKTISAFSSLYKLVGAAQGVVCYDKVNTDEASDVFHKYNSIQNELFPEIEKDASSHFQTIQLRPISSNAISSGPTPDITGFSPSVVSAGTKTLLTINGADFGTTKGKISFPDANTGGGTYVTALDSQVISWTDSQIVVEVPAFAGTGRIRVTNSGDQRGTSSSNLTVTFNYINAVTSTTSFQAMLQDNNGNGGYTFQYHTDFDTSLAKTYFEAAFELWNCESNINFVFGAVTTVDVTADDGINIVRFDNGTELSLGVLGNVKTRISQDCFANNRFVVKEMDITWNDSTDWYYDDANPGSNQHDFKSVALHELGHAHQLGHIIDPNQAMHYNFGRGITRYNLSQGDIEGAVHTMGLYKQSIGCGIDPMTPQYNCCDDISILDENFQTNVAENGIANLDFDAENFDTIQWQVSTDNGTIWTNLVNNTNYAGVTTASLNINNVPLSFNGNRYRAFLNNLCDTGIFTSQVTLNVIQYTSIPDDNFEARLGVLGYDDIPGDNRVPTNNIKTVTNLDIEGEGISNMAGIEAFTALEVLNASNNPFTGITLTANTKLKELKLEYSQISGIDLQNNQALEILIFDDTNLVSLNVQANTALRVLSFNDGAIGALNLSANEALESVNLESSGISELIFGPNHPNLTHLIASASNLTELDLSTLGSLEVVRVNTNDLQTLNIKNENNNAITDFRAHNNSNLNCILVYDEDYSTSTWTQIDAQTVFSDTSCGYTAIPDTAFEAALDTLGYDDISGDGQVPTWLIDGVTTLDVESSGISGLEGIEGFAALVNLNCSGNTIEELNMQGNLLLEELNCNNNIITDLNVQSNQALRILSCKSNSFSSLNVLNNENLEVLDIESNSGGIQSVDVSGNPLLRSLVVKFIPGFNQLDVSDNIRLEILLCNETSIPSLDLSNNNKLTNVQAHNNNSLTSIDVTGALDLEQLLVQNTQVNSLDVSDCEALKEIDAKNIRITALNLGANGLLETIDVSHNEDLTSLNVRNGNNVAITSFNATNVPNLSCVGVDDVAYSTANWTNVDAGVTFNNFCEYTAIPDTNFEAALSIYDDTPNDGQVPTDLIENVVTLVINNKNINDLTGIEDFAALGRLRADRNNLQSLDVSNNRFLKSLIVPKNNLETLVLGDISLENLTVFENQLTELDLQQNMALRTVSVRDNQLVNLNIKNGNNTEITNFLATGNPNLTCILVDDAAYSTTDWTNIDPQTSFSDAYCQYTQIPDSAFETVLENLGYDDISGDGQVPTALIERITELELGSQGISDLTGIEDFKALYDLRAENNGLTDLDFRNNPLLEELYLRNNPIATLDITNNTLLKSLLINAGTLSNIDLHNNSSLRYFEIENTNIELINLSNSSDLQVVYVANNNLASLNIKNGFNSTIEQSLFRTTGNPNLTCIAVDDITYSTANWTSIDAETSFTDDYCRYTAIPDSAFETALENLGYDDISGDGQVPTALIELITSLDVQDQLPNKIENLTGIEDFTALEILDVSANNISELDLSANTNLIKLNCRSSAIEVLNLTGLSQLEELNSSGNRYVSLNLTTNVALQKINCSDSSFLTGLNLSSLTALTDFDCNFSPAIEFINIKNGYNGNIVNFNTVKTNNLTCIAVDDVTYSTTNWLNVDDPAIFTTDNYCRYTQIPDAGFEHTLGIVGYDDIPGDGQVPTVLIESVTSLSIYGTGAMNLSGIEDFVALTSLNASYSNLTNLDVSGNHNLNTLIAEQSAIDTLDLGTNLNYETIILNGNLLTGFEFQNLSNLKILNLGGNPITNLDLSTYTALETFDGRDMNLTNLNIKNNNNAAIVDFKVRNNPNLTCITVDDVAYAQANFTSVDAQVSFNDVTCTTLTNCPVDIAVECSQVVNYAFPTVTAGSGVGTVPTSIPGFKLFSTFGNSTYFISDDTDTAMNHFAFANANNYNIVTIESEAENSFVRTVADDLNLGNVLIGYNDLATEDVFEWQSGIPFTYDNWKSGEPNNIGNTGNNESYTMMLTNGQWNDVDENTTSRLIIEFVDYSNGPIQITGLPSGSVFPVGVTENIFTIEDAFGVVITCSFNVTVTDVQAPSIVCSDIVVANDPGKCTANLTVLPPTVFDACGNDNILDSERVDYKFTESRRGELIDTPTTLNGVTNVLGANAMLEITFIGNHRYSSEKFKLLGPDGSEVLVANSNDNCVLTRKIVPVDQAVWNGWVSTYGSDLIFTLKGNDFINRDSCNPDKGNYYRIKILNIGNLEVTNDYNNDYLSISDIFPLGTTLITWTVTDRGGNTATCTQHITVNDNEAPTITCPADITVNNEIGHCSALVTVPLPVIEDNCSKVKISSPVTNFDFNSNDDLIDTPTIISEARGSFGDVTLDIVFKGEFEADDGIFALKDPDGNEIFNEDHQSGDDCTDRYGSVNIPQATWNTWISTYGTDLRFTLSEDPGVLNSTGDCQGYFQLTANVGVLTLTNDFNGTADASDTYPVGTTTITWTATDDSGNSSTCTQDITVNDTSGLCTANISAKVLLQGAALNSNTGEENLMRDDLRALGVLPTRSPYPDGVTCDASLFDTTGADAIVDWVWVELRDKNDATIVVSGQSAFLQRDGDVVGLDGISEVVFSNPADDYYVSVTHRNHLGIRTANTLSLSGTTSILDLTNDFSLIQGGVNSISNLGSGRYAMLAGDVDGNGQIQNADINSANSTLGNSGYNNADTDMNGQVQNSDIQSVILQNSGKGEQIVIFD